MNTISTISKDDKAGNAGIADNEQDVQHNTYDTQAMNTQENSISDTRSDEVFRTEEKHLHDVYAKLVQEKKTLEAQMIKAHERAQKDLKEMSSEVRQNFGSDDEAMETYAAIETLNAVIDVYNQKHDFDADRLKRIDTLLLQPYFAKVVLQMRAGRPPQSVYIGAAGITDEHRIPLVVDWRSPIAQTYYNQENGLITYEVNGKKRQVTLSLRRQFDIVRDCLRAYFDSDIAIEDALLKQALARRHSEKLQAITATIQREQNKIIRYKDVEALLIDGIAGSGKTSVLLQRIAYLLYQQKDTLSSKDIYFFAPNDVFAQYINMVLPQLGEQNPQTFTWKSFIARLGLSTYGSGVATTIEDLHDLEHMLSHIQINDKDIQEIKCRDTVLLKVASIKSALEKFAAIGWNRKRIALVKDELHSRLDRRITALAQTEDFQDALCELDVEQQMQIFNAIIAPQTAEDTLKYARIYAHYLYDEAHEAIECVSWLNFAHIAQHNLTHEHPTSVEIYYLHLLLCDSTFKGARFVVIDEVQDYTPAQLYVLTQTFHGAHFIFAGDERQALTINRSSFSDIEHVLDHTNITYKHMFLSTSYRSSKEITDLFWSIFSAREGTDIVSVQMEGEKPHFISCDERDTKAYVESLQKLVDARDPQELCAIITREERGAKWLAQRLHDGAHAITRITANSILPQHGIVIMNLKLAKGLEFDHVILADAQSANYPCDTEEKEDVSRRCLYTALSRATHRLDIVSQGMLTPLLCKNDQETK